MSRSLKKQPFIYDKLQKKVEKANKNGEKIEVKVWKRAAIITPEMIGHVIKIHNGIKHISREITQEMVGYKLGVFSPTRKLGSHGKAGKR